MKVVMIDLLNYEGQYSCLWYFFHLLHYDLGKNFYPISSNLYDHFSLQKCCYNIFKIDYIFVYIYICSV